MEVVGDCAHHPAGSIREYEASRCRDCGVTAHRARMFACDRKIKAVATNAETCAALATTTAARESGATRGGGRA